MDYSKTHYYKFSNSTPVSQNKSTIPDFERDDMPAMYGTGMRNAQQTNQRTVNDVPATRNMETEEPTAPEYPVDENVPAEPGFGPIGPVTPALPSEEEENVPAEPGFGPIGPVTPSLPSGGTTPTPSRPSTGGTTPTPSRPSLGTGNILWSWAFLSPVFSNIASVAQARFYNVAAIQEPVDIYINGQLLVSDLDYSEYTDFLYIIPGYYTLTVYSRTNLGAPIINERVNFARNSTCLVSILGDYNSFRLQFIC
ncbi:MAG: DUF4397 domain-containing protein [Lachnospiraceae bacterium]